MPKVKESLIKEVARAIAKGNTCYIHRYSTELTTIDPSIEDVKKRTIQEEKQAKFEKKIEQYIKIEDPSAEDKLVMMKDFLDELPRTISKQLSNALNRKNPVRNFNQVIESDIELQQHWRNFNIAEYQRWVSNFILDAYHYSK